MQDGLSLYHPPSSNGSAPEEQLTGGLHAICPSLINRLATHQQDEPANGRAMWTVRRYAVRTFALLVVLGSFGRHLAGRPCSHETEVAFVIARNGAFHARQLIPLSERFNQAFPCALPGCAGMYTISITRKCRDAALRFHGKQITNFTSVSLSLEPHLFGSRRSK
jgi:hypothetical protein